MTGWALTRWRALTRYSTVIYIYIRDSQLNRPESVSLASLLPIIVVIKKNIVIERTRDLISLKVVATDFSLKIISPSTGENSGDLA